MKTALTDAENSMNEHRNELQNKYTDKLRNIKDICSTYFIKYEKDLNRTKDTLDNLID